jgi:hypothetical protein
VAVGDWDKPILAFSRGGEVKYLITVLFCAVSAFANTGKVTLTTKPQTLSLKGSPCTFAATPSDNCVLSVLAGDGSRLYPATPMVAGKSHVLVSVPVAEIMQGATAPVTFGVSVGTASFDWNCIDAAVPR